MMGTPLYGKQSVWLWLNGVPYVCDGCAPHAPLPACAHDCNRTKPLRQRMLPQQGKSSVSKQVGNPASAGQTEREQTAMATIQDKWAQVDDLRNHCPNDGECELMDIECWWCDAACELHELITLD